MKNFLKIILFFVIGFSILPLAHASLEDLIKSFNFDFNLNNTLIVQNQTDFLIDTNNNSIGDNLFFNLSVNATVSGTYDFFIDLEDRHGIVPVKKTGTITTGVQNLQMNITTALLTNNEFNYSVKVYNGSGTLVFRKFRLTTTNYSNYETGFNVLSFADSNVNNNVIRVNATVNATKAETYNVTLFLQFNSSFIKSMKQISFNIGANTISLDFDNETIKRTHYTGVYIIDRMTIGDKIIDLNGTTNSYNYETFAKTSYFKSYADTIVDIDNDNLTDFLKINYTIEAKQAAAYTLSSQVFDQFNNFVTSIVHSQALSVGANTVEVIVNGSEIYKSKID